MMAGLKFNDAIDRSTVTGSAQAFTTTLTEGGEYVLSADTDLYWRVGTNPTASSGHFLPAGVPIHIRGGSHDAGKTVRVIKKSGAPDGEGTLTPVQG